MKIKFRFNFWYRLHMKNRFIFLLALLYGFTGTAQNSISGNFTPATEFTWLIAYELTPGSQRYIADTAIKEGYFKLELPENASAGMYRLVYAVPQEEFYIDVIYSGKENIEFNYDLEDGPRFISSAENRTYYNYLEELRPLEQELLDFYAAGNTSPKEFKELTERVSRTQQKYEAKGAALMAHQLIKANAPYIPNGYEDVDTYYTSKKNTFLNEIDFGNRFLQASGFLKEKLSSFVFTALPLQLKTMDATQTAILGNVTLVLEKLKDAPAPFKTATFYELWKTADANSFYTVSDVIFNSYLKEMAAVNGEQTLIDEIELLTRLRIGAPSPDISWTDNGRPKTLSNLEGAAYYLLVFWSSTCSHCLNELPALHSALVHYENIKVVAVGLEDDDTSWTTEKEKLPNFEHALALGKWDSDYAQLFGIQKTPTYFILDTDKRFVATPDNDKEVVAFLNNPK